jgi:hypothetical protein
MHATATVTTGHPFNLLLIYKYERTVAAATAKAHMLVGHHHKTSVNKHAVDRRRPKTPACPNK